MTDHNIPAPAADLPITADAAQVASLSPEARAGVAQMLKDRYPGRVAEIDKVYGTPEAGGDATPTYPSYRAGAHGYSANQAIGAYDALANAAPVKMANETDEAFAARQAAHTDMLAKFAAKAGDEFGLQLVEDDPSITPLEHAFDGIFNSDPTDIRPDNALVRDLPNGADVVKNWGEALAPVGMPAGVATQLANDMLRNVQRLKDYDEPALSADWAAQRPEIERMAARMGMPNWDAVKANVKLAVERIPEDFRKQIINDRALSSVSVVIQLALAGQRITARAALKRPAA